MLLETKINQVQLQFSENIIKGVVSENIINKIA